MQMDSCASVTFCISPPINKSTNMSFHYRTNCNIIWDCDRNMIHQDFLSYYEILPASGWSYYCQTSCGRSVTIWACCSSACWVTKQLLMTSITPPGQREEDKVSFLPLTSSIDLLLGLFTSSMTSVLRSRSTFLVQRSIAQVSCPVTSC